MKSIHFFGCSFTAGDELSDDEFFPWKKSVATVDQYFKKRSEEFTEKNNTELYFFSNKDKAYPSKIKIDSIKCLNHAENGAAVKYLMFKILKLKGSGTIKERDVVYFQIPPFPRELYISMDDKLTSIQLSALGPGFDEKLREYGKNKIMTFSLVQWAFEDIIDLIFLKLYLTKYNIPLEILDLDQGLDERIRIIKKSNIDFSSLIDELNHGLNLIRYGDIVPSNSQRLLAGHFDEETHSSFARFIETQIVEKKYSTF